MNICIISGSNRQNASSANVAKYIQIQLNRLESNINTHVLDLYEADLPMWQEGLKADEDIKQQLDQADAYVFVIPEWHAMVPPAFKNVFYFFTGSFSHKPAYIVTVSAGTGGRYPISELRMNSHKNSFINYIPISTVIDHVNETINDKGEFIAPTDYIASRVDEGLQFLLQYSQALKSVRNSDIYREKRFKNGM